MALISAQDREYLENKYHRTDEPFNAYNRMAYHGYEFDPATGLDDSQMDAGLAALSEQVKDEPHALQKAKLFAYVLDNTRIDINEHDYFVALYATTRPLNRYTCSRWNDELTNDPDFKQAADWMRRLDEAGESYGWLDFDHTVPDWDSMMALGFSGLLARAVKIHDEKAGQWSPKQETFFEGMKIEYEAVLRLLNRLYERACARSFDKADAVKTCLKHLRDGAPQTMLDALQMIYFYFMVSECIESYQVRSLGYGLDQTLFPFFRRDLENGVSREDEELYLSHFLMQWSAIGNYWGQPMYLGGTRPDGVTRVNELSFLILDVYDRLGIYNPKIQLKFSDAAPKAFVMKALEMIRGGNSSIVFCSEQHMLRSLMAGGASYEEAADGYISGCYEYGVKAKGIGIGGFYPNPVKGVSLVFDDGFDTVSGRQIGPHTGDVTAFVSFEQFYRAYLDQLKYFLEHNMAALDKLMSRVNDVNPSLLFSCTIPACVEKMTDALDNAINNGSGITLGGLGTAADALMAVKELVFDRKLTTLAELKEALDKNWDGFEALRLKALACKHKYGNGDPMADNYAQAILAFIFRDVVGEKTNCHGGRWSIEAHSARAFVIHGEKTKATPDGRHAGDEISKNASPTPGMDRNGVTALIRSATTLDTDLCRTGFCLDVMLHPTAVQGADGIEAMYGILKAYMARRGASIHFNIFNPDVLLDAQKHPENYRNLQVRVCGWNQLWNNMDKKEQDAYILRAQNIQ